MKLKVEVNVDHIIEDLFEDFHPEDGIDVDLKEEVISQIIKQTKGQVLNMVRQPLKEHMIEATKQLVKLKVDKDISRSVKKFSKNVQIRNPQRKSPEDPEFIDIAQWIKHVFNERIREIGPQALREVVDHQANVVAKEMRDRYDLMFAANLITKLNDQGLLKENVYETIMDDKKKE